MTDLNAIQKVVNRKAAEQLDADIADLIKAFKATTLHHKLETLSFMSGEPTVKVTVGKLDSATTLRYLLGTTLLGSVYLDQLKEWLLPFYVEEQAAALVKKFENITDLI